MFLNIIYLFLKICLLETENFRCKRIFKSAAACFISLWNSAKSILTAVATNAEALNAIVLFKPALEKL